MQLKAGVGMGEGENVVEVDGMNVGEGVGVTAGVSRTRSVGSTSGCTYSRMSKMYQYYVIYILFIACCQLVHILNKCTYLVQLLLLGYPSKSYEPERPHI